MTDFFWSPDIGDQRGDRASLHQRLTTDVSLRYSVLDIQIETRDRHHTAAIVERLERAGFVVSVRL